jgi:subtilisin family serine protease
MRSSLRPQLAILFISIIYICFPPSSLYAKLPSENPISDEIYIQFKYRILFDDQNNWQLTPGINKLFASNPVEKIKPVFPGVVAEQSIQGMDRTYRVKLEYPQSLKETLRILNQHPDVVYAEPVPLHRMFEISDDPLWNSQYHLSLVALDSARDIHHGSDTVSIAIIDGGVNYLHEDLQSEIWVNVAEDVDGDGVLSPADNDSIDADNNGFLDDVIGWDFVHLPGQGFAGEDDSLADNDPMDFGGHGTHCAGDAAAATNNGIGIASVGGNCRIMCIRAGMTASNGFGYIYYSVESIYYAANNGAKVISMSYGGNSFSQTEQTAIDFAYNQGAVCIAAAGNDANTTPQYPANYNHVMAVAATDQNDLKSPFSNYGTWIDVSAPGEDILSTSVSGNYGNMSGTSMSTPIVAGLAGLTYSMFPHYSPDSVMNRIKTSCDNIDTLNPSFAGQLGAGRINAFKTLDKVIRILSYQVKDSLQGNDNGRLDYGETIDFILTLKNTYQNATGVNVYLRSLHPILGIIDSIATFGNVPLGGTSSNSGLPFSAVVGNDSSVADVSILLTVSADGNYQYQKILKLIIGQREILIVNDDDISASSKINYYTEALDSLQSQYDIWDIQQQGTPGISQRSYPIIIWYTGEAEQNVLTVNEQQFLQDFLDNGGRLFLTGQNIGFDLVEQQNGIPFFENYLHASYIQNNSNDFALDGIPADPIGGGENFIILGSGGANNQNSPDVIQASSPAQPAILYDINNTLGQAALSYSGNYKLVYFAFGWEGINNNGPAKRVNVMNRIINWLSGSTTGIHEDKSELVNDFSLYQNYPNPFNPQTTIAFSITKSEKVIIKIFNNLGQIVKVFPEREYEAGFHSIQWDGKNQQKRACSSGVYYYRITVDNLHQMKKMILMK